MKSLNWMGSFSPPLSTRMPLSRACDIVLEWMDRARERRLLARLDDRLLTDIGMSRSSAWNEHSKHFWEK